MLTVVIADDSVAVRARVRELISEIDTVAVVGEADDGIEAIQVIGELKPDVAILDIRMPRSNGIQTLEAMREKGMSTAVIVLTAFPNRQYRDRCLESGAAYFFDKANEFERVAEVLEQMTSGAPQATASDQPSS